MRWRGAGPACAGIAQPACAGIADPHHGAAPTVWPRLRWCRDTSAWIFELDGFPLCVISTSARADLHAAPTHAAVLPRPRRVLPAPIAAGCCPRPLGMACASSGPRFTQGFHNALLPLFGPVRSVGGGGGQVCQRPGCQLFASGWLAAQRGGVPVVGQAVRRGATFPATSRHLTGAPARQARKPCLGRHVSDLPVPFRCRTRSELLRRG